MSETSLCCSTLFFPSSSTASWIGDRCAINILMLIYWRVLALFLVHARRLYHCSSTSFKGSFFVSGWSLSLIACCPEYPPTQNCSQSQTTVLVQDLLACERTANKLCDYPTLWRATWDIERFLRFLSSCLPSSRKVLVWTMMAGYQIYKRDAAYFEPVWAIA